MRFVSNSLLLVFIGLLLNWHLAFSQCDIEVEANIEQLEDYIPLSSGKYYRSVLFPYEAAKLPMSFYYDKVYRFIPCGKSDKGRKKLVFNIYNAKGLLKFSSTDHQDKEYFDFYVGESGKYTVVSGFPEGGGCAALIIGFLSKDKGMANKNRSYLRLDK